MHLPSSAFMGSLSGMFVLFLKLVCAHVAYSSSVISPLAGTGSDRGFCDGGVPISLVSGGGLVEFSHVSTAVVMSLNLVTGIHPLMHVATSSSTVIC